MIQVSSGILVSYVKSKYVVNRNDNVPPYDANNSQKTS